MIAGELHDEGWKLHVSANAGNAAQILGLVLPTLRQGNFVHKFLPTHAEVVDQDADSVQMGKVLAVYPDNIFQAFDIIGLIDAALKGHVSRADSPVIRDEIAVGESVVYTRYGGFSNDFILDPDTKKYVLFSRGQTHPAWIQNPWPSYPSKTALAALNLPAWPDKPRQERRR
jgi:hypothetical protein